MGVEVVMDDTLPPLDAEINEESGSWNDELPSMCV